MNYNLVKDILSLLESFENSNSSQQYSANVEGFSQWIIDTKSQTNTSDLDWEGKVKGRSIESVISTLLVHMSKYAKSYSKSAIHESEFSTQEEFIYLITLNSFGSMRKTELIKRNKMDKPAGIQIINRLIKSGWIEQVDSKKDKRSKILALTEVGKNYLTYKMDDIRKASKIVTADLSDKEKIDLVRILSKMDKFHQKIYDKNLSTEQLLKEAFDSYTIANNPNQ
ncbi:MarR family winged helix-turn-helix transcriptional regulator [Sphingobacterium bovistauri]|uniref:Winged helix-turn-helix transcriptional regulator n=1 Tax=Sphingobacterium bovistauri TaxID=2781959 RepID=A0ABS7ZA38_9SPHI|nr:MarR family winged helix-turn-helix transcriptional regulator [Sphingobacterium bovistauri]MCA5005755.1 winged helix-turn-helix transcriptional regulator [Sphingobacterium bovistauri]